MRGEPLDDIPRAMTLAQVAEEEGLSIARVQQLERSALAKLRKKPLAYQLFCEYVRGRG